MYLVLGATLTWESLAKKSQTLQLYLTAIIFPMLFGVAIELAQHLWFSQRTGDGWDILANFIGIIIGFRLVVVISSKL
jgi:VanZ family protein